MVWLYEDFDDSLFDFTLAYAGCMGITGIEDAEITGYHVDVARRLFAEEGDVTGRIVGFGHSLAVGGIAPSDAFPAFDAELDVDVASVSLQTGLLTGFAGRLLYIDVQSVTVQFDFAWPELFQVMALEVVESLLEKRVQAFVDTAVG